MCENQLFYLTREDARFRRRDDHGREILITRNGNPKLVVSNGRLLGVRATDGSVIPIPERRLEQLPDAEWVWFGGVRVSETEPPVCEVEAAGLLTAICSTPGREPPAPRPMMVHPNRLNGYGV